MQVSFVADGTASSACDYAAITDPNEDPCGRAFILSDGFQYVWNGYGGTTYVLWENPQRNNTQYSFLGNCTSGGHINGA